MFEQFFPIPGEPLNELLIAQKKKKKIGQTPLGHRPLSQRYVLLSLSSSVAFPSYSHCVCQFVCVCTCFSDSWTCSNTEWSLICPLDIRVILTDLLNYIPACLYIKPLLHECLYLLHSAQRDKYRRTEGTKINMKVKRFLDV